MESNEITSDYSLFDPIGFLEKATVLADEQGQENQLVTFILQKFHSYFKDGSIYGKRLLDLGTGPMISSIISASPYFENIYLSDVALSNLSVLDDWSQGSESYAQYINPTLQYCIDLSDQRQSVELLNRSLREKVKGILKVDVTKENPLTPNRLAPFDVITSRNCLDGACSNAEEYKRVSQNTSTLLVKGGKLVLGGLLNSKWYKVSGVKFSGVNLSSEEFKKIYESAGFKIEKWDELDMPEDPFKYRHISGCYTMVAVKK